MILVPPQLRRPLPVTGTKRKKLPNAANNWPLICHLARRARPMATGQRLLLYSNQSLSSAQGDFYLYSVRYDDTLEANIRISRRLAPIFLPFPRPIPMGGRRRKARQDKNLAGKRAHKCESAPARRERPRLNAPSSFIGAQLGASRRGRRPTITMNNRASSARADRLVWAALASAGLRVIFAEWALNKLDIFHGEMRGGGREFVAKQATKWRARKLRLGLKNLSTRRKWPGGRTWRAHCLARVASCAAHLIGQLAAPGAALEWRQPARAQYGRAVPNGVTSERSARLRFVGQRVATVKPAPASGARHSKVSNTIGDKCAAPTVDSFLASRPIN